MRKVFFIALPVFLFFFKSYPNDFQTNEKLIEKGLAYLESYQIKENMPPFHFKGEWPSHIYNVYDIFLMGDQGESAYDANCFTTAMVHNVLATMYLENPAYETIPDMLNLSVNNLLLFRDDKTFNFWHRLPPEGYFRRERILNNPEKFTQRRPTHYYYYPRYLQKYTNLPDDADDTAASYIAIKLFNKISALQDNLKNVEQADSIGYIFSEYRDFRRRNFNMYNLLFGHGKRTKAFLTWLDREPIFTPLGLLFPRQRRTNMPFRTNEICCVVNTKVLQALELYDESETEGYDDACNFINRMFEKDRHWRCGIYYPTLYSIHMEVTEAIKSGVQCLEPTIPKIIRDIKAGYDEELKFWPDKIPYNDIQSTIYATISLLNLKKMGVEGLDDLICSGIDFITNSTSTSNEHTFWCGGVFFSGGTIIRDGHVWVSDPVTTALAIKSLHMYNQLFF